MAISLTLAAAGAVRAALHQRSKGIGVRLCISTAGCSGMSYWLEFADELGENEMTFNLDGVRLLVNTSHLVYLEGLEIDYVNEQDEQGFLIRSPNLCQDECTCSDGREPC